MQAFRRFTIDWRLKSVAFRCFDAAPGGRTLYYLTQRYVTRTFPRNLADHGRWAFEHARTFRRLYAGDAGSAHLFEFGAGWDLHNSLVQWCYGINRQTVVDIVRWARADQINHAIRYLRAHPPPGSIRVPEAEVDAAFEAPLARDYGIRYLAPADARHTGLPDRAIDLICTTSVLEHVPPSALREITAECRRLSHPGTVVSHVIDYTDHFAHSDPSITVYNFLRFSERDWTRHNPGIHYQNRLRHHEYGDIFRAGGFREVAADVAVPDGADQLLRQVPLDARFQAMSTEQLRPRTAHWILRPDASPDR
jgi:hypothetical protein